MFVFKTKKMRVAGAVRTFHFQIKSLIFHAGSNGAAKKSPFLNSFSKCFYDLTLRLVYFFSLVLAPDGSHSSIGYNSETLTTDNRG